MDPLFRFKKFMSIDKKMLPMKLHFLLYAFAISSVMSYFPIMVKGVGLSTIAVGVIYTISPFTTVLINPLFGWVTDKLQRVKIVMLVMISFQTILFFSTVFVPSLSADSMYFPVELSCSTNNTYVLTSQRFQNLPPNSRSLNCSSNCTECLHSATASDDAKLCGKDIKLETEDLRKISHDYIKVINISDNGTQLSSTCHTNLSDKCKSVCGFHSSNQVKRKGDFASYQFWILLFLMVSSIVLANSTIAIGDAACYEALEGRVNQFGKQRIWLSIGWGIGTLFTGYFLDLTNPNKEEKVNFTYCAYVMLVLIIFDIIALSRATLTKPEPSKNIMKDVCKIFARPHPIFFALATLLIGLLSGIQWHFEFWYLEDMGASKLLLGLSIAVVCILAETPFMFVSGWIVKRIGRDNSMVLAFASFALWFLSVSFIHNPWWVLIINMLRGPTYGLFYVAMTSYGKIATAPGTEATMQTVLGAIFHGLGIGSGGLLGGLGFDKFDGRRTYRFTGYFAIGVAIFYKCITYFVAGEKTATYKGGEETTEPASENKLPR